MLNSKNLISFLDLNDSLDYFFQELNINEIDLHKEILISNIIKQVNYNSNISAFLINSLFCNLKYIEVDYIELD